MATTPIINLILEKVQKILKEMVYQRSHKYLEDKTEMMNEQARRESSVAQEIAEAIIHKERASKAEAEAADEQEDSSGPRKRV